MVTSQLTPEQLLPAGVPVTLLDADGQPVPAEEFDRPADEVLLALYRMMVLGRRFDVQATALPKQGRLAVYPSARGQEAWSARYTRCAARTGCSRPTAIRWRSPPAAWTPFRC